MNVECEPDENGNDHDRNERQRSQQPLARIILCGCESMILPVIPRPGDEKRSADSNQRERDEGSFQWSR